VQAPKLLKIIAVFEVVQKMDNIGLLNLCLKNILELSRGDRTREAQNLPFFVCLLDIL
jgi:hypothetical protein